LTPVSDVVASDVFRAVMGSVCTPVTVVTVLDGVRPHGTTVSAFASLSLDPPMVVVALDHSSDLLSHLQAGDVFGVNVLSSEQQHIAAGFAKKGQDKFAGVGWSLDVDLPRIAGAAGWLACQVCELVAGGDHTLVLGSVVRAQHWPLPPLTYHRSTFGTHSPVGVTP
jgi:flavin reductase (DIM6/NTAB) family NADH-FMN oxidoreductase RutF